MRSPLNSTSPEVGRDEGGDHLEQRRLSGAVRTDHREDLALADVEGDVVVGGQPAVALGDVLDLQERVIARPPALPRLRMPFGRNSIRMIRAEE